jgi:hypothetical protein
MMKGLRIYYNFIRPHMALGGKTLAQQVKIDVGSNRNLFSLIKRASEKKMHEGGRN